MTFLQLINQAKNKYKINELVIRELIYFHSSIVNENSELISKRNCEIDFNKKALFKSLKQYNNHKSLSHITKSAIFCNNDFFISKNVLSPRPETEWITDLFNEKYKLKKNLKVLDLCAGSGCIGCSIKIANPSIKVTCVEKYRKAYKTLVKNAKKYNTNTLKLDCFKALDELEYDIIISNPPYVNFKDKNITLSKEPSKALYAKNNGLYFYERFIEYASKTSKTFWLEIGFEQKTDILKILNSKKIKKYEFKKDINNNDRLIIIN